MKITILICLITLAVALAEHPRQFKRPSAEDEDLFKRSYHWGYYINPSRFHKESRNNLGHVDGSVSFVDANGHQVEWNYKATPQEGFKVTKYRSAPEGAAHFEKNSITPQIHYESPLFKSAFQQGNIVPAGYEGNQARFSIGPELVESSGRISDLAKDLDAIPVAAVHDGRGPPEKMNRRDQTAPLLIRHDPVPTQEGRNFYLLLPVLGTQGVIEQ